jgi:mannose-1-phosphate guanylyltransferase
MTVAGMILCAGLGTRLRPLTGLAPKPAVPVCGVPLVRWSLGLLARAGVARAVVNVHHLPEAMAATARAAAAELGLPLEVSPEPVIAGTGGALREARGLLLRGGVDAVVVVNGDVLFDVDLEAALAAHLASGALATMVLMAMPPGARYAAVELDEEGRVRRIAGRFGPGGEGLTPWHFPGVHVLSRELFDLVPAAPYELDVNRDVYPALMARGLVRGLVVAGYWNDLGAPERYLAANLDAAAGRIPLARFALAALAAIDPSARVAPGARVLDAVLGAGVEVPEGARVERAVLWPGTRLAPGEVVVDAIAAGALRVAISDQPPPAGPPLA